MSNEHQPHDTIVNLGELDSRKDGATPISNMRALSDDVTNFSSIDYNSLITIARASALLGVSFDTIRKWEKKGLVKAYRNKNKHRFFQSEELQRLKSKLSGNNNIGFKILQSERKTNFQVLELFAGAGGLALGLHNSGLKGSLFVEINKNAADTLKTNMPSWHVINDDVSKICYKNIYADILAGGFPCQAFSYAGKRLGFEDIRGSLFFEYARAIEQIKPKIILAENVKGLEKHDEGRTLSTMIHVLSQLGYRIAYKVLRAQYLDVAQKRERLVIIGVRNDLSCSIIFPKEQDYTISIAEVLKDVPISDGQTYTAQKKKIMELIPEGGYWRNLPDVLQRDYMGASYHLSGGKTGMARRLSWNEPSLTLTCNPAQKQTERCHPSQTRPLTIREYARIQSFPDSWKFVGSRSSQYKQIGNAVPVNLAYHIGRCLVAMLENYFDHLSMTILPETQI